MARETTITFGQVAQIADTLKASGQKPTSRAIRERIGSGSMGTIHKFLQQWKGKAAPDTEDTDAPEIPSAVIKTLTDWIATAAAEATETASDQIDEMKEEAAQLAADNEQLNALIESMHEQLNDYRGEIGKLSGMIEANKAELKKASERDDQKTAALEAAQEQIHRAEERAAAAEEIRANLKTAQAKIEEQQQRAIEDARTIARLTAHLESATERVIDLEKRNEQERTAANIAQVEFINEKRKAKSLELENDKQRARINELEAELKKPRTQPKTKAAPKQTENKE